MKLTDVECILADALGYYKIIDVNEEKFVRAEFVAGGLVARLADEGYKIVKEEDE